MPRISAETFARVVRQMAPVIATTDIETAEALAKLCDPFAEFEREDGIAIAAALLLELRSRASLKRR
jgi:hypothetical protein